MADNGNNQNGWRATKEKILMSAGLSIIGVELIHAELFSGTFHLEFLLAGLALCGVSIAQWGDRK
jgi:hypothetical protein